MTIITQSIRTTCVVCGAEFVEVYEIPFGGVYVQARKPGGWHQLDEYDICRAHKVKVIVDGRLFRESLKNDK